MRRRMVVCVLLGAFLCALAAPLAGAQSLETIEPTGFFVQIVKHIEAIVQGYLEHWQETFAKDGIMIDPVGVTAPADDDG